MMADDWWEICRTSTWLILCLYRLLFQSSEQLKHSLPVNLHEYWPECPTHLSGYVSGDLHELLWTVGGYIAKTIQIPAGHAI